MRITKAAVTKKHRVYLYGDMQETIAVLEEEPWLSSGLHEGDEIAEDVLLELQKESDLFLAKRKALDYLSRRSYCKRELEQKLQRIAGAQASASAVARMCELGLVNDEKYAKDHAIYLMEYKKMAPRAIRCALQAKGIDRELAVRTAESLEAEMDPRVQISALLHRKYMRDLQTEKGTRRAVNGMLRLGYEYDDIKAVLQELLREFDGEEI